MNLPSNTESAQATAEAVARRSYGKLVALLAAHTRDLAAAEDALAEAFAAALARWPAHGCPENPEGWLFAAARRKVIDVVRRRQSGEALARELATLTETFAEGDVTIPDQRLSLMFACAHPSLNRAIRAPLILQVVMGLDAARIASAFMMSPSAMSQRLVRAKSKIREAGIPFRVPLHDDLPARLDAVLDAIYATFAEGWVGANATDVARRDLAEEALFLGRLVCELMPEQPEALGLLALMLHAEARRRARRDAAGEYLPFNAQDLGLWDAEMIAEAELWLHRASALGAIGRYQLEGALQSAHVFRRRSGTDNWDAVVELYEALYALSESPVVAINRAVALAERDGAAAGLDALRAVEADARLAQYQPYWAARAELFAKQGDAAEARRAYELAIGLESDPAVRRFLQRQKERLSGAR